MNGSHVDSSCYECDKTKDESGMCEFSFKSKIITFHKLSGLRTGTVNRRPPKLTVGKLAHFPPGWRRRL